MSPRPDIRLRLHQAVERRTQDGLRRRLRPLDALPAGMRRADGRVLVDFASSDYLGLSSHPALAETLARAARVEGTGSGAAHLVSGHRRAHAALEEALADWTGRERALVFSAGVTANLGVLQALLTSGQPGAGRGTLCLQDRLNHASLIDGALLAGAELRRYPHGDAGAAGRLLLAAPDVPALIATDGVFSMDGDVAPLPALAELARQHRALLYVDDAHGLGVLGSEGRGCVDAAGLGADDVPLLMGTFGKALGCAGAFVAGDGALVEGIVQFARTFVYTTAMPAALAATVSEAVRRVRADEDGLRARLHRHITRFRTGASERGLPLMPSSSAIQPVLLGDVARTLAVAAELERAGYLVGAIRPPTVPRHQARLRITLSAAHHDDHLDGLLDALASALARHPVL